MREVPAGQRGPAGVPVPPLSLRGHGLVLRQWREDDAASMQELFGDPALAAAMNLPVPFDAAAFIAALPGARRAGHHHLAITEGTDVPLGLFFLWPERGVLGYGVGAGHRGRRLAVRALRLATVFCHGELGVTELLLPIFPDNLPSQAVAAGAGYRDLGGSVDVTAPGGDGRGRADLWVHRAGWPVPGGKPSPGG
ncbi:GNAT family N-acetyltransferase [Streptomyces sp. NPDC018964]|uniref:GNAT family N-acetyltransferase n=1 Tax=unclassified Streptomyces TaxID=2593676 RepID=UPI0037BCE3B2